METEKLFYRDSFMKEFEAKIIDCEPDGEGYRILLDQTGFFPEGGGQTADTGFFITKESFHTPTPYKVCVSDVQEEAGLIYHSTDKPLETGTMVKGVLNFEERFLKMQHHSGEHIVSGLVHKQFGYNNVGFHLGSQVVTLDFDGILTKEQLRKIEWEANQAVAKNIPIQVSYPSKEELASLKYRSKIAIEGQVRIITIPGYDVCACCAPHVKQTGQIGQIKLVNMQNYKGGVRLFMLCGFAALKDYCEKEEQIRQIAQSLSANESQTAEAVEKLRQELFDKKGEIAKLQDELLDYKVQNIKSGAEKAVMFETSLEGNQLREMANKLLEKKIGIAAVFSGNEETGYRYVIGSRSQDMRQLAKKFNQLCDGRGGGKPEMVQGQTASSKEKIENFFQTEI
ncbi:MAG: DHHA1 domain-containing protein [Lachnospiraceae bacterium]|nr:DHHA1 domain-containing protein [Lachnospiraceae bacterium]